MDVNTFTYDHMERLLTTSLSHDGADAVTLSSNTYDAVGRLASCAVNDGGSNTSYAYNVRGWMQSVTNNHFYQWLHYQDAPAGGTPCFNGNISGITWLQRESMKAATSAESVYRFQYDGLNRLTQATYASNSEQWNGDLLAMNDRNFSCTYAYDLNSNMTALQRYGVDVYNTSLPTHIRNHGMIDNLTMTYDGNRLKKVTDQCEELSYAGAMDFKDGADKDEEYTYDANGNMTCDRNKGIHSITYNMLNLPETVLFNDGHETRYTYAADGRKLRTEYRLNNFAIIDEEAEPAEPAEPANFSLPVGGVIDDPIEIEPAYTTLMTRDYCGNYIYSNGALERILTDNGYIQGDEYYFYIKDYQGNIRVVLNQSNQPVELNSYYPYGALMAATATEGTQPYKYSAKELDRQNGLDLYDSQARHYDPIIPRTTTMDPLAEKYYSLSPYTWCAANPINLIDEKGDSIAVLHKSGIIGHLALLIQNNNGEWRYFSMNGTNIYRISFAEGLSGGKPYHDLGKQTFKSPTSFLYSNYNREGNSSEIETDKVNNYGYDEAYIIPTTKEQDKKIESEFRECAKNTYSLINNQCAQVVQKALNAGGLKTNLNDSGTIDDLISSESIPYFPGTTFQAIRINNPNGKLLVKP